MDDQNSEGKSVELCKIMSLPTTLEQQPDCQKTMRLMVVFSQKKRQEIDKLSLDSFFDKFARH